MDVPIPSICRAQKMERDMRKWILFLLWFPFMAHGAEAPTPKQKAETFLSSVKSGDVVAAYNRLFIGSSIPTDKPQAVTLLKQQTQAALPIYGKVIGYEFLLEEMFGDSVIRLVYLLKSEKHPTFWEFYFYKPKSEWFLSNILFNDQFQLLDKKK